MNSETILSLQKIDKDFGGIHALQGVDFTLEKGEVHALLGENGAGKSTLIKILTGVHKADGGQILLHGEEITVHDPIDARKKGIAAIYQELSLIESLTVAENIFLGNEPVKTPLGICDREKLYRESDRYLENFHIAIDSRKKISELGMGQKRIVEIVKALAIHAEILLLDEPTTGMSKAEIDILFQIMKTLKEKKVTMIYISHYLDEVFRVCDRATVFRDGKHVAVYKVSETDMDTLIKAMIGKEIRAKDGNVRKGVKYGRTLLELEEYQTDQMKEPVSFAVREGEILGVTGIVGAGKSELAHGIFGSGKRIGGRICYREEPVTLRTPADTKRCRMAFVPEDRKSQGLFLEDSVADNMVLVSIEKIRTVFRTVSRRKKKAAADEMGKKLKLQPLKTELPAKNLSGGNQQKVVIGKWLSMEPEIILMDEPTRGIDVGAKSEIYQLIKELAADKKGLVVFSSEFEELISLCDRILVLYKGKITGEVLAEEATNEKLLSLALGGTMDGKEMEEAAER